MKIRVGGFFSGIGAHHSAIERISHYRDVEFEVVFQCEWDEKTALAYDTIHGKTLNLGDVTKVNDIGGDLAVDILYWTPPCQDISLAGKLAGNDEGSGSRSSLAFEVPRILQNTPVADRPKYLVFEEVPMMISSSFFKNFKMILKRLTELGYRNIYGVMNAADYGVAQSRERCFMISKLNAAAEGKHGGRPKRVLSEYQIEKAKKMLAENPQISKRELCAQFNGISRMTLLRLLKEEGLIGGDMI